MISQLDAANPYLTILWVGQKAQRSADRIPVGDAPVGADDVAARLAQQVERRRGAGAEVNRRHASFDRGEDPPRVRQGELLVIRRTERADPRVEQRDRG